MTLRGPGDDSDDNDRRDKGRFSGLIAFDFPAGRRGKKRDRRYQGCSSSENDL